MLLLLSFSLLSHFSFSEIVQNSDEDPTDHTKELFEYFAVDEEVHPRHLREGSDGDDGDYASVAIKKIQKRKREGGNFALILVDN